jgi:hypothetical protein
MQVSRNMSWWRAGANAYRRAQHFELAPLVLQKDSSNLGDSYFTER